MPPKKNPEPQSEQSKRFKAEVRKRAKAGDFDPVEAGAVLDKLVRKSAPNLSRPLP